MKLFVLTLSLLLVHIYGNTQPIRDLIQAERDFAAWSVQYGTKDAFIKFLDSTGVVFEKGNAVNGLATWNARQKNSAVLNWHPRYAAISRSNDLGFTTGPWTYQKSPSDTVTATGHYSTIWRKDNLGRWKFIVDLGVDNNPRSLYASTDTILGSQNNTPERSTLASLLQAEKRFIKETRRLFHKGMSRLEIYKKNMAVLGLLNRNNRTPSMFTDMIMGAVSDMPKSITYSISGSGISKDGDMGYVYGTIKSADKSDNYLRIWVRENGQWRILHEVLRY